MRLRYKTNLTSGCFSLILGGLVWFFTPRQIEPDYTATYGITSRTMPYLLAAVLAACGLVLVIQSLIFKKENYKEIEVRQELKALGYMLVLIGYAVLFSVNFIFALFFLGAATLAFMKTRKKLYYLIVLVFAVGLYFVFILALHVRLP
ncbi:MAG: tripartite tricarboxylate transporter TctB family protein [Treponema sp.]|jgi:hypothetical protein|nr:tripartite tricarboxylate transporter TctB family protein [Treponema sp.]